MNMDENSPSRHKPSTIRAALLASSLDRLDAQLLMLQALNRPETDRAWLIAHDSDTLNPTVLTQFAALCQRRQLGEPMAYIRGTQAFWGLDLRVTPDVLIPRPDTETLVQWALDVSTHLPANARVLDMGTGSGAVAIALQHERRDWRIMASDVSQAALALAKENAHTHGLAIDFVHSPWFAAIPPMLFDLIVSNPPYVAEQDPHLDALQHEPQLALTSGAKGLDAITEIAEIAPAFLRPHGWLLLEHGYDQADSVAQLLRLNGFSKVSHRLDLNGIRRCTGGQWMG